MTFSGPYETTYLKKQLDFFLLGTLNIIELYTVAIITLNVVGKKKFVAITK